MTIFIFYYLSLIYLELLFKQLVSHYYDGKIIFTLLYLAFIAGPISFITKLFKGKLQSLILLLISFVVSLWFAIEIIFARTFGVFFSINTTGFIDQAVGFIDQASAIILNNLVLILIIFGPFLIACLLLKLKPQIFKQQRLIIYLLISLLAYGCFFFTLPDSGSNSLKKLYLSTQNNALNHAYFGVVPSTFIELRRKITNFQETIIQNSEEPITSEAPNQAYLEQVLDIDFATLKEKTDNQELKAMHEYFQTAKAGMQNEYTGFFEDKNLILFMAESFNGVVVEPKLTPTLYHLTNNGFVFENFYSPVILSTIGGEFQELTGLYPDLSMLSYVWRTGVNSFPLGIASVFEAKQYTTFAYHNHEYDFQERNVYLKSLGFDNYQGCGNGLEEAIDCSIFPKSDKDMIDATIDDYINEDRFMVYYATVSGHMNYDFTDNAMSIKHQDEVKDLPYSNRVKAYIATQIELDQALAALIEHLKNADKLDDTVIALVGDHYPYALSLDEMNEMADTPKDSIEINRSNFILYNSAMETVKVEKVGSQIDVLPTLYNLFAIPYDSRIIVGNDILDSTSLGLAIFEDRSWVSDLGTYYASGDQFIAKNENDDVSDSYIESINQIVANRVNISRQIMQYNYYAELFKDE